MKSNWWWIVVALLVVILVFMNCPNKRIGGSSLPNGPGAYINVGNGWKLIDNLGEVTLISFNKPIPEFDSIAVTGRASDKVYYYSKGPSYFATLQRCDILVENNLVVSRGYISMKDLSADNYVLYEFDVQGLEAIKFQINERTIWVHLK